eukprot:TRINITY_DN41829_c0_g2_i1.p1 TRINITY_DN41829_c0_g2~~TRINITY_DN41829_c0_g2_i1.p1  ORF type:complete len:257 (-),score=42.17 TRINITY_DN41829_c0_g2_i1:159-929(-)
MYQSQPRPSLTVRRCMPAQGDRSLAPTHQFEWRTLLLAEVTDLEALAAQFPGSEPSLVRGSIGQNLTLRLLHPVCVGDVIKVGSALLQVTGPRHPCVKNDYAHGAGVREAMHAHALAGFFVRVLRSGRVQPEDPLQLLDRPHPEWPYKRVHQLLYGNEQFTRDPTLLAQIAALPCLGEHRYRAVARRRVALLKEGIQFEGTDTRTCTPYTDEAPARLLQESPPEGAGGRHIGCGFVLGVLVGALGLGVWRKLLKSQ